MNPTKHSPALTFFKARGRTWILAGTIALAIGSLSWAQRDEPTPSPQPAENGGPTAGASTATPAQPHASTGVFGPIRPEAFPSEDERWILARLEERRSRVATENLPALARTIVREANRHDIDPELVLAVIDVESSYYLEAVSPVGARGLMQVMPATGEEVSKRLELPWRGEESLFDPHLNITLGVAYLGQLKKRFGDIEKSLAAYNWGPSRIDRYLRNGDVLPRHYVENVFTTYESTRRPKVSGS